MLVRVKKLHIDAVVPEYSKPNYQIRNEEKAVLDQQVNKKTFDQNSDLVIFI